MPRKGNVPKRDVLPDPMYGSKVVSKLINNLTFLSFCDLCSIIKRNYNQEGKNAFFER